MNDHTLEYKYAHVGNPLYHHNTFLGENNELYVFGGYGNHSYSNKIIKYEPENDKWMEVEFSGDKIHPRYFSAAGQGVFPSQVFIMGGELGMNRVNRNMAEDTYTIYILWI